MSLLDTIKGAREEAEEIASSRATTKKDTRAKDEASDTSENKASGNAGFSRKSAARAKPRRGAASSVRVGVKPESEMTKEEKRAAREAQRNDEDLMYDAKKAVLESNEGYRRTQRIWWIVVIVGMVCTVCSWLLMQYTQKNPNETMAMGSIVMMVLAYVLIIGAFLFDIIKVRPMRKQADEKVMGMSKRRMLQVVTDERKRKDEAKAKK